MTVTCIAVACFFIALLVHLLAWRVRLPRRHIPTLGLIFLTTLVAELTLIATSSPFGMSLTPWQYVHIMLFYVAMALAYIDVYPGLEQRSPRMTIAILVERAAPEGITRDQIHRLFGDSPPIDVRMKAMVEDHMLVEDGSTCTLTPKGRLLGWFFSYGETLARLRRRT